MSDYAKLVSQRVVYKARVEVTRHIDFTLNPNGRGYSEDNIDRSDLGEVMAVTVRADTPADLQKKVNAILDTMEDV